MFFLQQRFHAIFHKLGDILAREAAWLGKSYELNLLPFFDFTDLELD